MTYLYVLLIGFVAVPKGVTGNSAVLFSIAKSDWEQCFSHICCKKWLGTVLYSSLLQKSDWEQYCTHLRCKRLMSDWEQCCTHLYCRFALLLHNRHSNYICDKYMYKQEDRGDMYTRNSAHGVQLQGYCIKYCV